MYRFLFWILAKIGKPVGGIPPRRILHWLARRAYGNTTPQKDEYRWHSDRCGNLLLLHPHYFIDYSIIAFGDFEPTLHRFIKRHVKPGMFCFDIGANIGSVSLHLARAVGHAGTVYCFEPIQYVFDRLMVHIRANKLNDVIQPYRLALSNKTGTDQIWCMDNTHPNQGLASLVLSEDPDLVQTCSVSVITLDEFVKSHNIDRIDFMKVDIQGSEPHLIEGGRETLARLQPSLCIEVSPTHLMAAGSNSRSLLLALEELGYALFELNRDGRRGQRISHTTVPYDYYNTAIYALPRRSQGGD